MVGTWCLVCLTATVCATGSISDLGVFNNGIAGVSANEAGTFTLHDMTTGLEYATGEAAEFLSDSEMTVEPGMGGFRMRAENRELNVWVNERVPFVAVTASVHNPGEETISLNEMTYPALRLRLPNASSMKALGTAGLSAPDGHPGSYTFLTIADPETRAGVVVAWVTQEAGSGVLFSSIEEGEVVVRPRLDFGRLQVEPDKTERGESLAVGYFDDVRKGLEAYADLVATVYDVKLPPIPSGYCTWYSSPHGGASDARHVAELAKFAEEKLKPYGYDFIQIDDMWQGRPRNARPLDTSKHDEQYLGRRPDLPLNGQGQWWWGPHADFTSWNPKGPYPEGMQPTAEAIAGCGFRPGLWLMPFAWDPTSPALADHPDWFVKRPDGTLHYAYWAGWSLDMTHPGAREFLAGAVRRIVHEWGYDYLKLDGLFAGGGFEQLYVNDGYRDEDLADAVFSEPAATPVSTYREGLKVVREAAGDDTFILGCNVSQNMRTLGASFGLVDAMRIGPDNGPGFPALKDGPWHGSNRYFLHGRVWYNDPDPVYVRPQMPIEHARLISSWVGLSGQLTVFSDWLPGLPEDRLDILKRVLPNHGLKPRPVDWLDTDLPRIWLLTDTRDTVRRDVVGLFNWDPENPAEVVCKAAKIGLPEAETYVGFDFWANEFMAPFGDALSVSVPAGSTSIVAVRPVSDHPQVISVNRHIGQGIVSLRNEAWDAARQTLSGEAQVVGGEPYELRVVLPDVGWQIAETVAEDAEASYTQEGDHLRVSLVAPENRTVHWEIWFRK